MDDILRLLGKEFFKLKEHIENIDFAQSHVLFKNLDRILALSVQSSLFKNKGDVNMASVSSVQRFIDEYINPVRGQCEKVLACLEKQNEKIGQANKILREHQPPSRIWKMISSVPSYFFKSSDLEIDIERGPQEDFLQERLQAYDTFYKTCMKAHRWQKEAAKIGSLVGIVKLRTLSDLVGYCEREKKTFTRSGTDVRVLELICQPLHSNLPRISLEVDRLFGQMRVMHEYLEAICKERNLTDSESAKQPFQFPDTHRQKAFSSEKYPHFQFALNQYYAQHPLSPDNPPGLEPLSAELPGDIQEKSDACYGELFDRARREKTELFRNIFMNGSDQESLLFQEFGPDRPAYNRDYD